MHKFGSVCYAYKQDKKKLDSRCEEGIFVGYDKNSPAYMVYFPHSGKVQKSRLVKFVTKTNSERETQTETVSDDDFEVQNKSGKIKRDPNVSPVSIPVVTETEDDKSELRRYPSRVRKKPAYLCDSVCGKESEDQLLTNIDYCYRLMCNIPLTFREALTSSESKQWVIAMDEEMQTLKENDTFILTNLPQDEKAVGGKWVYDIKTNVDGSERYKARYVEEG